MASLAWDTLLTAETDMALRWALGHGRAGPACRDSFMSCHYRERGGDRGHVLSQRTPCRKATVPRPHQPTKPIMFVFRGAGFVWLSRWAGVGGGGGIGTGISGPTWEGMLRAALGESPSNEQLLAR